jgi:hypothetical protein
MHPDVWTNSGVEQPCFPFTGKPGINAVLEDPSNPLEYFELLCTPEIKVVNSQRNKSVWPKIFRKHAQSKTKIWDPSLEGDEEKMKLLVFFLLTRTSLETGQKEPFFLEENSGNTHIFGPVQ